MNDQPKARLLLVEDTYSLAQVYLTYLRSEPYEVHHVETGREAMAAIKEDPPQVILLDLQLPDMDGREILAQVTADQLPCAVVVITAHGSMDTAVQAMRGGAFDFIVKPFSADRLRVTVRNAVEQQGLRRAVETYQQDFDRETYHGFIGRSLEMQSVYRVIDSAAASKATVFITGESGVGKELCAEAVHQQSDRRGKPFIALNCGAIPHNLMESEILGHVKGAFTGAISDRDGAATQADGGVLFLDEICEMPADLQTKLLRFVQTGSFTRVGGSRTEQVDVRFLCATNRDPWEEVTAGRFREDLFYRLHVIPLALPPLRARGGDIVLIADKLLRDYAAEERKAFNSFDASAEQVMLDYGWPGNVRELQNAIRKIVVLNDGERVTGAMLSATLDGDSGHRTGARHAVIQPTADRQDQGAVGEGEIAPFWRAERQLIERAINVCGGNIPKAAGLLELSPSTIYRKRAAWAAADRA